jgi:rubredoxin
MSKSKSVLYCSSCGYIIDANKLVEAMGLGGFKNVMIPVSKCPKCQSKSVHVETIEKEWWQFWK